MSSDVASEKQPPPPSEDRFVRAVAFAMVVHGVLAAFSWMLTRGYVAENGGTLPRDVATVVSVGFVALGAPIWARGDKWQSAARAYTSAVALAALAALMSGERHFVRIATLTLVSVAALLLLVPVRPGRARAVGGFVGVAVGTSLIVLSAATKLRYPPLVGPPAVYEASPMADDVEVIEGDHLPEGAVLRLEEVDDAHLLRRFVMLSSPPDTTFAAARERGDAWVKAHLHVPPGVRIAWWPVPDQPRMVIRSYTLRDSVLLSSDDVKDARVRGSGRGMFVEVTLRPGGAARLRPFKGRLATSFDGAVQSVAMVRREITNGRLSMTLGPDGTEAKLEAMAMGMRGELFHGP